MRYINRVLTVFQAGVLLGLSFGPLAAIADTLKIGGTGSALGTMRILADAYRASRPDTQIVVVPALSSSGGIKAVVAGALDIGLSGRPLKPAELGYNNLVVREIARTPLVLASRRDHAGFSLSDIARIYDGTLQTWPDGSPLRPILRPEADTKNTLLRAMSPEIDRAFTAAYTRKGVHVAITDQDSADAIERIPGAVGVSTLALILSERRKIKALPLEGVSPSVAALERGSYPYFSPLYLVVTQNPSGPAQAFAAFIQSRQGARILADNGYLPVQSGGK